MLTRLKTRRPNHLHHPLPTSPTHLRWKPPTTHTSHPENDYEYLQYHSTPPRAQETRGQAHAETITSRLHPPFPRQHTTMPPTAQTNHPETDTECLQHHSNPPRVQAPRGQAHAATIPSRPHTPFTRQHTITNPSNPHQTAEEADHSDSHDGPPHPCSNRCPHRQLLCHLPTPTAGSTTSTPTPLDPSPTTVDVAREPYWKPFDYN